VRVKKQRKSKIFEKRTEVRNFVRIRASFEESVLLAF